MTDNEPLPGITFVKRSSHRATLSHFRLTIGERNDVIGRDRHVERRCQPIGGRLAAMYHRAELNFQFAKWDVENYSSADLPYHLKRPISSPMNYRGRGSQSFRGSTDFRGPNKIVPWQRIVNEFTGCNVL